VEKVSRIVAAIADSATEQAAGIEQGNRAAGEMGRATRQDGASSEESSSAAEELIGHAEELAAMVRTFQLRRARPGMADPPDRSPAASTPGHPSSQVRSAPSKTARHGGGLAFKDSRAGRAVSRNNPHFCDR